MYFFNVCVSDKNLIIFQPRSQGLSSSRQKHQKRDSFHLMARKVVTSQVVQGPWTLNLGVNGLIAYPSKPESPGNLRSMRWSKMNRELEGRAR